MRLWVLGLLALLSHGCGPAMVIIPTALDATLGGVGIYQRIQARETQQKQTEEIAGLREEVRRLRKHQEGKPEKPPGGDP